MSLSRQVFQPKNRGRIFVFNLLFLWVDSINFLSQNDTLLQFFKVKIAKQKAVTQSNDLKYNREFPRGEVSLGGTLTDDFKQRPAPLRTEAQSP